LTTTVAFPLGNYPNGTHTSGNVSVADADTSIEFSVARCTDADATVWPNAGTTLFVSVDQSNDGGASWQNVFQFTGIGGIITDKHGVQVPRAFVSTSLNPGTGRVLRATATIAGGPLRTSGQFDVN
jgi:hypothetical protein